MDDKAELPAGWCEVSLKKAVSPRKEKAQPQDFPKFPYLGMDNVASGTGRVIDTRHSGDLKSSAASFYSGDVLYGRLRPYLNKVVHTTFSGLASAEFIVLPGNDAVDPRFLAERLRASDFVSFASHLNEGDRPRVNFDQIGDFTLHLPPIDEQRRIVAKIEELFSELDNGVESLKTARAQLQTYRQSLLKAAFEGRLTEQWRRDHTDEVETADQLLLRIRDERKARYQEALEKWRTAVSKWEEDGRCGKKPRKPSPPKFGEAPSVTAEGTLPEGWYVAKIADVADVGTGVTPLKKRSDYYDGGTIPWVTSTAVNREFIREPSGYVTETALSETNLRLYPKGTLLVAMYGEGKTRGKASELAIEATTNQALAAIRCEGVAAQLKTYLKWFLVYNYDQVRDSSSGGVQPNLNLGIVENTEFPICPLEEQKEIVDRLESAFARTNELERVIESSLNQSEVMRQSILKRAFEGKLVAQDPNDEPANVLLERIRQDQTATPAPTDNERREQEVTAELFDDQP